MTGRAPSRCDPALRARKPGRAWSSVGCFDLDGVLLDSEAAKLVAWDAAVRTVLEPSPVSVKELSADNIAHRGVPRRSKFEQAARRCGASGAAVDELLRVYALLLAQERPAPMPGARRFVALQPGAVAVVTSAPRVEAMGHLDRLGFQRFDHVFDGSTSKTVALARLSRSYRHVWFFGDAEADRVAAATAHVGFIAIGDRLSFHPRDLARARDLRDPRLLELVVGARGLSGSVSVGADRRVR